MSSNNNKYKSLAISFLALTVHQALAKEASQSEVTEQAGIERIMVSTQKRTQSLQDVPLSVTALSEKKLEELHLGDANDIFKFTPGLVSAPDYATAERTAVRGVGSEQFGYGFDNHVGTFIDGVYQTGVTEFYDIAQVEVVKGPVGALFGRSSIAGAVSVTRNKPSEVTESRIKLGLGSLGHESATGMVNIPLTNNLYFRVAGKHERNDGYLHNVANDTDIGATGVDSIRAALRYQKEKLDATLTVLYEDREDMPNITRTVSSAADAVYLPGTPYEMPLLGLIVDQDIDITNLIGPFDGDYQVAASFTPYFTNVFRDVIADVQYEVSDNFSVKSLTNYRHSVGHYAEDFDANAVPDLTVTSPFMQSNDNEYFQQEIHFNYTTDDNWVFLFGSSYYKTKVDGYTYSETSDTMAAMNAFWNPELLGQTIIQSEYSNTDGEYSGWSGFLDVTIPLTEKLDLTVGGRYAHHEKAMTVYIQNPNAIDTNQGYVLGINFEGYTSTPVSNSDDWSGTTGRFALNYTLNKDVSFYASYAQGFKAGGIDSFAFDIPDGADYTPYSGMDIAAAGGKPASVDPESSDSYEMGVKSYLFGGYLQLNSSAFYYEFRDQQKLVQNGAALTVENIGKVVGQGLETEYRILPGGGWDISGSFAYLDAVAKEDESNEANVDEPIARSPKWTASLLVNYAYPLSSGEIYGTYSFSYQDEMRTDADPEADYLPSFSLSNFRLGYMDDDGWQVSAYVDNMFDKYVYYDYRQADGTVFLQDINRNISRPRTYGVEVSYAF